MKNVYQQIIKYAKELDHEILNRIRIIAIMSITLVFAVILYHGTLASTATIAQTNDSVLAYQVQNIQKDLDNQVEPIASLGLPSQGEAQILNAFDVSEIDSQSDKNLISITHISSSTPVYNTQQAQAIVDVISARAIFVVDQLKEKTWYTQNSSVKLPIASLTKLMTAVVVLEHLDLEETVTISQRALSNYGQAGGLIAGEQFSVLNLMKIMLIVSSNDAARAFDDHFIAKGLNMVSLMNKKAKELGMTRTHFANPSGLDASEHYSTASDLVLLASYSFRHGLIWDILGKVSDTVNSSYTQTTHTLLSHNSLLLTRTSNLLLGSKTGYTDAALGCMITVLKDGTIIVVLGAQDRAGVTKQMIQLVQSPL